MKEYAETSKYGRMFCLISYPKCVNSIASFVTKDADKLIAERGAFFERKCQEDADPQACENAFMFSTLEADENKIFKAAERYERAYLFFSSRLTLRACNAGRGCDYLALFYMQKGMRVMWFISTLMIRKQS
jgi:hypothetical protein